MSGECWRLNASMIFECLFVIATLVKFSYSYSTNFFRFSRYVYLQMLPPFHEIHMALFCQIALAKTNTMLSGRQRQRYVLFHFVESLFCFDVEMPAFGQRYNVNDLLIGFCFLSTFSMDWSLNSAKCLFWKMENEFLLNSFNMMDISGLSTTELSLHSYNKPNVVMILLLL